MRWTAHHNYEKLTSNRRPDEMKLEFKNFKLLSFKTGPYLKAAQL